MSESFCQHDFSQLTRPLGLTKFFPRQPTWARSMKMNEWVPMGTKEVFFKKKITWLILFFLIHPKINDSSCYLAWHHSRIQIGEHLMNRWDLCKILWYLIRQYAYLHSYDSHFKLYLVFFSPTELCLESMLTIDWPL